MDSISFCLACCAQVGENDCVIKQEVVSDSCGDMETDSFNPETLKKEAYTATNSSLPPPPLEEEKVALHCFLKIFDAIDAKLPSKVGMRRDSAKKDEGEDVVPFCGGCKSQLLTLDRLQQEVEKLEKELKEKVISAEPEFEKRSVYRSDKRYFKIRRKVLGDNRNVCRKNPQTYEEDGGAPTDSGRTSSSGPKVNLPEASSKSRRSTARRSSMRTSKPVSRLGIGATSDLPVGISDPVVLLSKGDKTRAEKCQQSTLIKSEPLEEAIDEDEDNFSYIDPIYEPPSPTSPTLSSSQEEDKNEEEEDDESDSWMPPHPSREESRKAIPKKRIRTRKRNLPEADQVQNDSTRNEPDKRKPGRPKRIRRDSEESLPGPKIKFKKNSFTIVDRKTGTITILKVALTRLEDGLSYKCSLCSEIFPNEKDKMTRHVIKNHSDRNTCHICGKKLSSPRMLKSHLRGHTGAAPEIITECPICAKPFARRSLLKFHKWSHYNEEERNDAIARGEKQPPAYDKKFQCDQCAKRFSSSTYLKRHLIANHLTEEERPKELCPICGVAVHHLQGHITRVHEVIPDEKKFSCTLCSRKFLSNSKLRRHTRVVHLDIREFQCTMCPKKFASNRNLSEHTQLHLNIRKFQCQFCSSGFVKKDHLQRHMKVYHEEGSTPKRLPFSRGADGKYLVKRGRSKKGSVSKIQPSFHAVSRGEESLRIVDSFKEELQY
ncbi:unnamed protein product [Orchesella dallaii]|uniref:C2H2-type domain-containing protein n=1 Tax=Orchesella dallaii TaxID=48710 RepID=A0ABP1RLG5_9HEXA